MSFFIPEVAFWPHPQFVFGDTVAMAKRMVESMISSGVPKIIVLIALLLFFTQNVWNWVWCLLMLNTRGKRKTVLVLVGLLSPLFFHTRLWHTEVPITPSYDCVECFAGAQAVTRGLQGQGFRSIAQDILLHSSMDLLSPAGFSQQPKLADINLAQTTCSKAQTQSQRLAMTTAMKLDPTGPRCKVVWWTTHPL